MSILFSTSDSPRNSTRPWKRFYPLLPASFNLKASLLPDSTVLEVLLQQPALEPRVHCPRVPLPVLSGPLAPPLFLLASPLLLPVLSGLLVLLLPVPLPEQ